MNLLLLCVTFVLTSCDKTLFLKETIPKTQTELENTIWESEHSIYLDWILMKGSLREKDLLLRFIDNKKVIQTISFK